MADDPDRYSPTGLTAEELASLRCCALCPRRCGADRLSGAFGYCAAGALPAVSSICAHRGEEPAISGECGICNVFFAHCNLQCICCQNYQISSNRTPIASCERSSEGILNDIERILDAGARGVGFVSPSHSLLQMRSLMRGLIRRGRRETFVYNTNGYDLVETIQGLERDVDVYLPDLKYMDPHLAAKYSDCPDYVTAATAAISEMFRQKGAELTIDSSGVALSGLIIRHLVLPGHVDNSKQVLRFIAEHLSPDIHISLMSQYHPTPAVAGHPQLGRRLHPDEYAEVLAEFEALGFERGWVQEMDSSDNYRPDFERDHPFE